MPHAPAPLPPPAAVPAVAVPRLDARALTHVTGLFLLSRLLVLAVAALSHVAIHQGPFVVAGAKTWTQRLVIWDANWYLGIVGGGYTYNPDGASSVGFYPLYPMLIRAGMRLGWDPILTGYGISHAALYFACLLLWRLAARETRSAIVAERAVLFLLVCPGALWFGLIYTESLFLLTMLGCMLCARRGRWLAAGAWGMASALTRTPGLLLAGFLFLEAVQQGLARRRLLRRAQDVEAVPADAGAPRRRGFPRWLRPGRWPWALRVLLGTMGPVAGQACYLAFLQIHFGDWRAQQKTMAAGWGGGLQFSWEAILSRWQLVEHVMVYISVPLLGITVALALAGFFTLRRASYSALVLALAALYVFATADDAITRYLSTTAPVYIVLAQLSERSRLLETTALVFSVAVMVIVTILCANGYHVT